MTPTLSLEAIVTAIACLCSTTDVRENQVSNLFYGHNTTIPQNGFCNQKEEFESIEKRINSVEAKIDRMYEMLQTQINDKKKTLEVDENCDSVSIPVELERVIMYEILTVTPFLALCKHVASYGNWLLIQRRKDGTEIFYRKWNEYVDGFGNLDGDHFVGLERLHRITFSRPHELLIRMKRTRDDEYFMAHYDHFEIDNETRGYALKTLGNYNGNAGDALREHVGYQFSTYDHDNDGEFSKNYAVIYHGAWWFGKRSTSHLNGLYSIKGISDIPGDGLKWFNVTNNNNLSLVVVEMLIKPKSA